MNIELCWKIRINANFQFRRRVSYHNFDSEIPDQIGKGGEQGKLGKRKSIMQRIREYEGMVPLEQLD